MNDPYKTLGVSRSDSLEEIKKSYRKLAKKYHPDINPNNKESEKKFKDILNAYELIGTNEAKEKFAKEEKEREQKNGQFYRDDREQKNGYSNEFENSFDSEDVFENIFGSRFMRQGKNSGIRMKGEDHLYKLDIEFKEAALGGQKNITLPDGRQLKLEIPAGTEDGEKIKFKGLGGQGIGGGLTGDVYVQISIKPHKFFSRVGNDIITEVSISFFEAISGAEIKVPTIDGSVMLKVPAGVTSGSKLRIKNKGIFHNSYTGHQIVILKVAIPKNIDPAFASAVQKLEQKYSYNPRESKENRV